MADYTKMTLGEMLFSPIDTVQRSAKGILKALQKDKNVSPPSQHPEKQRGTR